MIKTNIDISNEWLFERFSNGIRLVRQDSFQEEIQTRSCSVAELMRLPFHIYFMNTESKAQKINDPCAETCGFESANVAIGKTPFAVAIKENAQLAIRTDKEVLVTNKMKIVEQNILRRDGLVYPCLVIKMPWYDQANKIIGLFGCSIILGKHLLAESLSQIAKLGLLNFPSSNFFGIKINSVYLTKRETECLQLTVRGKTAKQIAILLGISRRTVEEYLTNVKAKMGVYSKSELIDVAFHYFNQKLN